MRIGKAGLVFLLLFGLVSCAKTGDQLEPAAATKIFPQPTSSPVPTLTPTAEAASCLKAGGAVERIDFNSAVLNDLYTVSIYTPPCYGNDLKEQYPVLYLLHGQNMDDTFWLTLGVADLEDKMIAEGGPPFIMVMPFEEKNFDLPTESSFGESVLTELIPWIEKNYAVCAERACRAIGGVSRGGGWAMRLAMRNFDVFGAVGGHSLGPMAGDWWQAQKNLQTHTVDEYPRIYIDRGEDDFLAKDIDSFVNVLKNNSIPHEFHIYPGAHDQTYWQEHVAEYLSWYANGWK